MTKKQKSNLARTAIFMLEHKYNLKMRRYYEDAWYDSYVPNPKEYNECGTTCCFAGHGPVAIGGVKKNDTWVTYVERVFTGDDEEHEFLFSGHWSDSKNQAAARALVFLRGESPLPEDYFYTSNYLTLYTKAKLITELQKFI